MSTPTNTNSIHALEGFHGPLNALSTAPLSTAEEESVREGARKLLPWNYGAVLDEATDQKLRPVGTHSQRAVAAGAEAPPLFQQIVIRSAAGGDSLRLKNRLVVSPMCMYSSDDGHANDFHLVHLGQYALGGAALVIMEATGVAPEGRISPADAGLWKDSQIEPLKKITAFLKSQDCRAGIQLAHAGRKAATYPLCFHPRAPAKLARQAVGPELGGWPSDIKGPSSSPYDDQHHTPHEMSLEEINTFKQQFVDAVLRAVKAGFEFIEIHAAHGYLLSSFLSPTSNLRTDQYGGSFENRIRLLLETVAAVREVYKGVLGVRFSCSEWTVGGWNMDDSVRLAEELAKAQVDVIDCSSGGNNPAQKIDVRPGYQVPFATQVRQHLQQVAPQVAVGAVGLITEPSQANDIVRNGEADLVLVAREFLRDPYFPLHAAIALGHDMDWAPQYQRAKPSVAKSSVP